MRQYILQRQRIGSPDPGSSKDAFVEQGPTVFFHPYLVLLSWTGLDDLSKGTKEPAIRFWSREILERGSINDPEVSIEYSPGEYPQNCKDDLERRERDGSESSFSVVGE